MSVLLMVGAGALGLIALSRKDPEPKPAEKKIEVVGPEDAVQDDFHITGNYGEMADIATILQYPGTVRDIKIGQDLYGTPCRWVRLRGNNCWYRTYNMDEDWCMAK